MGKGTLRTATVMFGIVALAPLTWWVALAIPDEIPADRLKYADYLWNPPDLTGSQRLGIGLLSLGVVTGGVLALADGLRSSEFPRRWVWVVVPLAGVACYSGFTYRFATAPVSGANIGGALLMLASFVVLPALMGISFLSAIRLRFPAR